MTDIRALLAFHCWLLAFAGAGLAQEVSAPFPKAEPLRIQQLENVFRYATNVFGGSSPVAASDFTALARLGIRTLVSVDGAKPLVDVALTNGIRYVHIPFGYAKVPEMATLQLVKVLRESEGGIYVHCHHGKHRGPAAAMAMLVGDGRLSAEAATSILEQVGTSPAYAGLYRDIARMRPVSSEELARTPHPPSQAEVPDFIEAMAEMDRIWDRLKRIQSNDWKTDPSHPDIDPRHEALMLRELFVESNRREGLAKELNLTGENLGHFTDLLADAANDAVQLEGLLRANAAKSSLDHTLENIHRSCITCHKQYRN